MKKKLFLLIIVITSFFIAVNFVFAQVTIPKFGPGTWDELLGNIIKIVRDVVGSVAAIMLIVAGIMYLISAGDPGRMTLAKQCLTYAIIGLVIALAAEAIVASIKLITG